MLTVVTFLWKNASYRWNRYFLYGPEHVDKLARGVRRHLHVPYQFVCFTDREPEAFTEPDEIRPLWNDYADMVGCYRRLKIYDESMRDELGARLVYLDLDVVITGCLDRVWGREEDFVILESTNPRNPYCGGMVLMTAGSRKQVWEQFSGEASHFACRQYLGTDQAWIAHCLGEHESRFTTRDGVYSYGKHIRYDHKGQLPKDAAMVFFNGPFDPSIRDEPWIREHWQ